MVVLNFANAKKNITENLKYLHCIGLKLKLESNIYNRIKSNQYYNLSPIETSRILKY